MTFKCHYLRSVAVGIGVLLILMLSPARFAWSRGDHTDKTVLNFGIWSDQTPTSLIKLMRPLMNDLETLIEKDLKEKIHIKISVFNDFNILQKKLVAGKVDFARVDPVVFVQARKKNKKISMIAVETANNNKHRKGMICVREGLDVERLNELVGKSILFGNHRSAMMRYLPQLALVTQGVRLGDLKKYQYISDASKRFLLFDSGVYDAAVFDEEELLPYLKESQQWKVLAEYTGPSDVWLAGSRVQQQYKGAIQRALLHYRNKKQLAAMQRSGFARGSYFDFQSIREALAYQNGIYQ